MLINSIQMQSRIEKQKKKTLLFARLYEISIFYTKLFFRINKCWGRSFRGGGEGEIVQLIHISKQTF